MAYFTTGLDLKIDALDLAGEPIDGSSEFDEQTYELLTVVQRALVSGGTFGPSTLLPEDWYWARAWPRGVIQLQQPYNQSQQFAAIFTTGSTGVSVNTLALATQLPDLRGFRIVRADTPARHMIEEVRNTSNNFKSIILREPWTGTTINDANWLAYPDTYELPDDFVRGCSPLFLYSVPANMPTAQTIDVINPVDLERMYPQVFPWGGSSSATATGSGMPVVAARVTEERIRFSHFLNTPERPTPVQIEFEYIRRPDVIAEGSVPLIPVEHRRILSYGAAYLILDDKNDSMMEGLLARFLTQWKAMWQEHSRSSRHMSTRWGVIQPPRASGNRGIMLTTTGLPVYVW